MKAMALTGIREIGMIERPLPQIKNDTDVLIKLMFMGVCGSDIHQYKTGQIGRDKVEFPFVLGHEGCGVVTDTGSGVTRVKKGDLIAIEPAMSCGTCDQCLNGRQNTCRNISFLGSPGQAEGLLSEFIIMPEACCFPLPPGLDPEIASLAEPLSIAIYATKLAGTIEGKTIAILGTGPIGISILLSILNVCESRVYATDLIDERLKMADNAGAYWTGNREKNDICAQIIELEPNGIDIVFECCGKQEAMEDAIEILKPGGKIVIAGIPEFDNWIIPADVARRKEINFYNVRRQNDCLELAVDLIAEGDIDPEFLITHKFAFPDAAQAFEIVAGYRDGVMKALIQF